MRSVRLYAVCLVAAALSASAMEPASPHQASNLRLERRIAPGHAHHMKRAPLAVFPGQSAGSGSEETPAAGGSSNTDTNTKSTTETTPTSTSTQTTPTSTSTQPTSTRTTSSSTAPTSTSSSTTPSTTSSSSTSLVLITSTVSGAPVTTSAPAPAQTSSTSEDSGGSHTGLIIGVSVVGGVAILGALIFLWMKFGGKRFSEYNDDDHDIKWPELKAGGEVAAMQPLPARRTGGAGFDMGEESENGHDGGDSNSMTEYGNKAGDAGMSSSTALHDPSAYGAYGHQGTADGYEESGTHYGGQSGVTGFYDPYGTYSNGHAASQGQQIFYPEQGGDHGYGNDGYDQGQQADVYGHHGSATTPPFQPYHVSGRNNF